MIPAFGAWSGPRDAKMVIVSDSWGEQEDMLHKPLAGFAGQELWKMLGEAVPLAWPEEHARVKALFRFSGEWVMERENWLHRYSIAITTVFNVRPVASKLESMCVEKKAASSTSISLGPCMKLGAKGMFIQDQYLPELDRLYSELKAYPRNVILACGNVATWALLRSLSIGSIRGSVAASPLPKAWKILPTYHPSSMFKMWSWRPIIIADLMKALRESEFPEIRRPQRFILIHPTIEECEEWTRETIALGLPLLSCDIETAARQITCVGFGRDRSHAMVIPFVSKHPSVDNYWSDPSHEFRAWRCVQALLRSNAPIVGQNFLYDLQYLLKVGMVPANVQHDTMLRHHSVLPEMQKGLGFLGSIYTNEASWKLMNRPKADTEKRDE